MRNNINAEPYAGRVYDPVCGSGGIFVQSENPPFNVGDWPGQLLQVNGYAGVSVC